MHPLLPGGRLSISSHLAASAVPEGLVSPAYLRRTRPATPLARDWAERTGDPGARLAADHVQTTLAATGDATLSPALEFARFGLPDGMQTTDPTLDLSPSLAVPESHVAALERLGLRRPAPAPAATPPPSREQRVAAVEEDVTDLADRVRNRLSPIDAVRSSVVARVPALDGLIAEGELPTTLALGPTFDDPLYWDLLALGASWILPGVGSLGSNRVRLLSVDTSFVGAFLIGANHELGRELLWRDYPVDLRATFFHRFWEYADPDRDDISDLAGWIAEDTIRENMDAAQETMTAVVVRGDLVRRYPTAHWFLQQAALGDDGAWTPAEDGAVEEVSFLGALDPQTAVYGFDLDPEVVRGDRAGGVPGYFVAVEEQPGAPRLGLDVARPAHFTSTPSSWDRLSWGHLVSSREELRALTHARATGTRIDGLELDGTTWGRNAAHMARATWQRPFRMLIDADLLI
jgi:hypothetical protein